MRYLPILLLALLFGCSAQNRCEKKLAKLEMKCPDLFHLHDTTIYKRHDTVIYYHDVITTPEVTHTDSFQIPCPDTKPITKKFKGGSATVSVVKGQVIVICKEDSLKLVINHKDSILVKQSEIIKSGLATRTIPADLTWLQKFLMWTGAIFYGIIIVIVIEKLFGGRILAFIKSLL